MLKADNYSLQLPSKKLSPRWVGPLKIQEVKEPNNVVLELPPKFKNIVPVQNVEHIKPYVQRDPELGPQQRRPLPALLVDGEEEYEVEDILDHRVTRGKTEYLVRFKGYTVE